MIKPIAIPSGLDPALQWLLDPNWDGVIAGLEERYEAWGVLKSIQENEGFDHYIDADFLREAFEKLNQAQNGGFPLKMDAISSLNPLQQFVLREAVQSYPPALIERMSMGSAKEKLLTVLVSDVQYLGRLILDSRLNISAKLAMIDRVIESERAIQSGAAKQSHYQWRRGFYFTEPKLLWLDGMSLALFPGAEQLFELFTHELGHAADDYRTADGLWSRDPDRSSLCDGMGDDHPICGLIPESETNRSAEILAGSLSFYFSAMAYGGEERIELWRQEPEVAPFIALAEEFLNDCRF